MEALYGFLIFVLILAAGYFLGTQAGKFKRDTLIEKIRQMHVEYRYDINKLKDENRKLTALYNNAKLDAEGSKKIIAQGTPYKIIELDRECEDLNNIKLPYEEKKTEGEFGGMKIVKTPGLPGNSIMMTDTEYKNPIIAKNIVSAVHSINLARVKASFIEGTNDNTLSKEGV